MTMVMVIELGLGLLPAILLSLAMETGVVVLQAVPCPPAQ